MGPRQRNARPMLLLTLWTVLMAASVAAAVRAPTPADGEVDAIGVAEGPSGDVQVRDSDSPLWRTIATGQELAQGAIIATGPGARVTVRFFDGHEIEVGPSSQILLMRPSQTVPLATVVRLVKGRIDARAGGSATAASGKGRQLVVDSGRKRVLLATDDRATVSRAVGAPRPVVKTLSGAPRLVDAEPADSTADSAVATPAVSEPADVPVPPASPEESPKPTRERAPRITVPHPRVTYWLPVSLKDSTTVPALPPVELRVDGAGSDSRSIPGLALLRNGRPVETTRARADGAGRFLASLDAERLRREEALTIRPTWVSASGAASPTRASETIDVKVASLADFGERPVDVALVGMGFRAGSGWIPQYGDGLTGSIGTTLSLASGADLPRIAALLRGSKRFAITENAARPSAGVHVVRDRSVVASLVGPLPTGDVLGRLSASLGGALIYTGPRAAFRGRVRDALDAASLTHVDQDLRVVALNTSLLRSNARALRLAESTSRFALAGTVDVHGASARSAQGAPPAIETWTASRRRSYPYRIVFVESATSAATPRVLAFDVERFNALGMFRASNPAQATLAYQLNNVAGQVATPAGSTTPATPAAVLVDRILRIADADALVIAPSTGPWKVVVNDGGKTRSLGGGAAPATRDADSIHQWLVRTMGFDGVALDRKGEYLLAAAPVARLRRGVQAWIGDGAIAEVVTTSGDLCVLKILLAEQADRVGSRGARLTFD